MDPFMIFDFAARTIVGGIFMYAGFHKWSNRRQFSVAIREYKLVNDKTSSLMSFALPPVEVLCGALLVSGTYVTASSGAILFLLLLFTGAVAIRLRNGTYVSSGCGCGIGNRKRLDRTVIWRNLGLMLMGAYILVYPLLELSPARLGIADKYWEENMIPVLLLITAFAILVRLLSEISAQLLRMNAGEGT